MTDFIDSSQYSAEPSGFTPDMRGIGPNDSLNPKRSRLKTTLLVLLILALILGGAILYFRTKVTTPFRQNAPLQAFTIAPGQSISQISQNLRDQGLISNATVFDVYAHLRGDSKRVMAGEYALSASMSMRDIADQFTGGKVLSNVTVVRIREGERIDEIADDLSAAGIVSKQDFTRAAQKAAAAYNFLGENVHPLSLEGYIFPDTYFVAKPVTATEIIDKALANTAVKIDSNLRAAIAAEHKSIYQILTMASIIEKEVGRNTSSLTAGDQQRLDQERGIVAGIFYNRLRIGMPLQSDATVTFITKKHESSASYADIQIDSPYNTYKYAGLPPGPIGNPSLASILAAVHPAQTDYLYFLSKPDGTTVFAKTIEEQNRNKQLYLK